MSETREKTPGIDGMQGLAGFIGITVGVIPLARWIVQKEHGAIFGWIFGDPSGSMGYVAPLVVVVVMVGVIAALEAMKRRA